jgi:predicted ribosomally synthesized peptide with SipW-like signal peptide
MNKIIKTLLMGMLLIQFVSLGSTYSYFTDTEYSVGNTFTATVWDTQASFLEVNTSKTHLTGTGDQSKLHGTTIRNIGSEIITVDKIQVDWNTTAEMANVTEIKICGKVFFSGSNHSGEVINGSDYVLESQQNAVTINFRFDASVSYPFTIKFIMGDGASKTVTITENLKVQKLKIDGILIIDCDYCYDDHCDDDDCDDDDD